MVAVAAVTVGACSSKPAASVSRSELAAVRETQASIRMGDPTDVVLGSFKAGNKVKLGTSMLGDASIEEWKVEAFHDAKKSKDLFVIFLYFCDDRFVDSSDTRIDFRNNPALVQRWRGVP